MAQDKPIPLVGRLAIQLKMLSSEEVARAIAESESTGNPRLAQVMVQMGLLDRDQVAKLQQVQKDLVDKQRARTGGEAPESSAPTGAVTPPADRESRSPLCRRRWPLRSSAGNRQSAARPTADENYCHRLRRFDRRSQMKNGPPASAVTTPTGISVGASAVRESASQTAKNAAPSKNEQGISAR